MAADRGGLAQDKVVMEEMGAQGLSFFVLSTLLPRQLAHLQPLTAAPTRFINLTPLGRLLLERLLLRLSLLTILLLPVVVAAVQTL